MADTPPPPPHRVVVIKPAPAPAASTTAAGDTPRSRLTATVVWTMAALSAAMLAIRLVLRAKGYEMPPVTGPRGDSHWYELYDLAMWGLLPAVLGAVTGAKAVLRDGLKMSSWTGVGVNLVLVFVWMTYGLGLSSDPSGARRRSSAGLPPEALFAQRVAVRCDV